MYGKSLLRRRGESVKRSFAHCYETGGMRRTHLRGREKYSEATTDPCGSVQPFNLSLILRALLGSGKPREWKNQQGEPLYILASTPASRRTGTASAWIV
jgi:transposase